VVRRLVVACGAASLIGVPGDIGAQTAPASLEAPAARGSAATLRPGDTVRLRVWREPDLSGEFMVNENWDLTLPRLGVRSVRDVPIDSLRARLVRDYAEFIREATIELTPLYRVRVTGAVRNPGLFTVDPTMSVADAVGLAGGVSPQGREGHIALVRDGRRVSTSVTSSARLVELSLRSGDELHVPERAWLSRNAGLVIGAVSSAVSLVWAIRQ
jgi:polysaccharide export outer membrane protein